jgi:hypothetical protein
MSTALYMTSGHISILAISNCVCVCVCLCVCARVCVCV